MKDRLVAFLDTFWEDILSINASNVIITGSHILQLHGLNISWTPEDLDIAIYAPTREQKGYICKASGAEPCLSYEKASELGIVPRAWKKTIDGKTINFILEYKSPTPNANLHFLHKGLYLRVQNIDTIIAAKLSYGEGQDKSFLRRKDAWHLSELKSLNFNVTKNK